MFWAFPLAQALGKTQVRLSAIFFFVTCNLAITKKDVTAILNATY